MLHGRLSPKPLEHGELVLIDLTPQVEGYCANLARTFVLGKPDDRQRELLATYLELVDTVRPAMCPGATVAQLDELAADVREPSAASASRMSTASRRAAARSCGPTRSCRSWPAELRGQGATYQRGPTRCPPRGGLTPRR